MLSQKDNGNFKLLNFNLKNFFYYQDKIHVAAYKYLIIVKRGSENNRIYSYRHEFCLENLDIFQV